MCLAVPMKITETDGCVAIAELSGITRKVRVDLIDGISIGDYVLVHAGLAISKIDEQEAMETLALLEGIADEV